MGTQKAKCIGRESNPGLADSFEMRDLEWQRPILPLNHQCYLMKFPRLYGYTYACHTEQHVGNPVQPTRPSVESEWEVLYSDQDSRLIVLARRFMSLLVVRPGDGAWKVSTEVR